MRATLRRVKFCIFPAPKKKRSGRHVLGTDFLDEEVELLLGSEIAAFLVDRQDWGSLDAPDDPRTGGPKA